MKDFPDLATPPIDITIVGRSLTVGEHTTFLSSSSEKNGLLLFSSNWTSCTARAVGVRRRVPSWEYAILTWNGKSSSGGNIMQYIWMLSEMVIGGGSGYLLEVTHRSTYHYHLYLLIVWYHSRILCAYVRCSDLHIQICDYFEGSNVSAGSINPRYMIAPACATYAPFATVRVLKLIRGTLNTMVYILVNTKHQCNSKNQLTLVSQGTYLKQCGRKESPQLCKYVWAGENLASA